MMTFTLDALEGAARLGVGFLVQSSLLLLAGLVAGRLMWRSPVARGAVYRAALISALVVPVAAWGIGRLDLSAVHLPVLTETTVTTQAPDAFNAAPYALPIPSPSPLSRAAASEPRPANAIAATPMSPLAAASPWAVAGGFWALGCALLLTRLAVCHGLLWRMCAKAAVLEDPALMERLSALGRRMAVRAPSLRVSDAVSGPVLCGFLRPVILIPHHLSAALSGDRMERVLIHELAHLSRRDCLWSALARFMCAAAFFQPLLWLVARRMEEASDELADDMVLERHGNARRYAADLAELAERFAPCAAERVAGAGVIHVRSALERRVLRITNAARALATRLSLRARMGIGVTTLAAIVLVGCVGLSGNAAEGEAAEPADAAVSRVEAPMGDVERNEAPVSSRSGRRAVDAVEQGEERILETILDKRIEELSFTNQSLPKVADSFRLFLKEDKVNVVIDPGLLQEDILVTFQAKDMTVRNALALILGPFGLDFAYAHGAICVGTPGQLQRMGAEPFLNTPAQVAASAMPENKRLLEETLARKIEGFSFDEQPLPTVIDFFKRLLGDRLQVLIDPSLTKDDVLISVEAQNLKFHEALTLMLKPAGLDYGYACSVMYISTPEGLRSFGAEPFSVSRMNNAGNRVMTLGDMLDVNLARLRFNETPLPDALQTLRAEVHDSLNFVVTPAVNDKNVTVTLDVKNVRLRTVLDFITKTRALYWAEWNDAILVYVAEDLNTIPELRKLPSKALRTYDVSFYLAGDEDERLRMAERLLQLIRDNLTGRDDGRSFRFSWSTMEVWSKRERRCVSEMETGDSSGTAYLKADTGALVVNHFEMAHERLTKLLNDMRPLAPAARGDDDDDAAP